MASAFRFLLLTACGGMLLCAETAVDSPIKDGTALNNLGVQLRQQARPADAMVQFNAAIRIAEDSGDDRLLGTALAGLGACLVDQGEYARAQPVLRRSLALFEKTAGPDSLETGEAANNLAMVYRKDGNLAQAQEQLERALPLMQKYLDAHSRELEIAYNNMFIVLAEQKKWDAGEEYLSDARSIAGSLPDSLDRADIEENLALLQSHRGQFADAVKTMQRVIAIREQMLGPENPRLAASLESYAAYLRKTSQKAAAERIEQRARVMRRASLQD